MARGSKPKTVRNCVTVLIIVLAVFLSIRLLPAAHANDDSCLRIALPEATQDAFGLEIYREVMSSVGLCVDPIRMPNARAVVAMRAGEVDGVFAVLDEFADHVDVPVIRGHVLVGNPDGLLVVRKETVTALSELTTQSIGVWLGSTWSEELLSGYGNIVRCPGGPDMMMNMLRRGRIDGMLINSFSLEMLGGAPEGFITIPVRKLPVRSWLQAKHSDLMPQFDKGTELFRDRIIAWRARAQ